MTLQLSETDWPLSYNDHSLLIGPLRMERQGDIWVYCWNDPGVSERFKEQCRAILDMDGKRRYEP